MHIPVEPQTGGELDRLITALLNATGVVYRVIESTGHAGDGVELIGRVASRLRGTLALMAEHSSDEELALVTRALAETTLLVAGELGLGDCFGPG
jgi:hypothetical protein